MKFLNRVIVDFAETGRFWSRISWVKWLKLWFSGSSEDESDDRSTPDPNPEPTWMEDLSYTIQQTTWVTIHHTSAQSNFVSRAEAVSSVKSQLEEAISCRLGSEPGKPAQPKMTSSSRPTHFHLRYYFSTLCRFFKFRRSFRLRSTRSWRKLKILEKP